MSGEIRCFSEDKLGLVPEKAGRPPEADEPTSPPVPVSAPRVPAIVTETRIPNALFDEARAMFPGTEWCTVVVVQGDDPEVVARQISALRRLLKEDETS